MTGTKECSPPKGVLFGWQLGRFIRLMSYIMTTTDALVTKNVVRMEDWKESKFEIGTKDQSPWMNVLHPE